MKIKIKAECRGYDKERKQEFYIQDLLFGNKTPKNDTDNPEIAEYLKNTHRDFNDDKEKLWLKSTDVSYDGEYFIMNSPKRTYGKDENVFQFRPNGFIRFLENKELKLINIGTTLPPEFISEIKVKEIIFEFDGLGKFYLSEDKIEEKYLFIS